MFNPANAVTFEEADGSALLRGGNISKREGKTTMRRVMRTGSYHFSYQNVADHINRVNSLTTISSAQMARRKRRWHWTDAMFRPVARFLRFYIFKRASSRDFRDFLLQSPQPITSF
jgi:hypothetical protein